jgi:hypothetical protein
VRIALLACLVALVGASLATGAASSKASAFYTVRPDPRMCPSPLCGGHWLRAVNTPLTRCSDGVARVECYVARAVDEERRTLASGVPTGAIVRGFLEPRDVADVGRLGELVVSAVWSPIGKATPRATVYRLRDSGIRCVKAPCFWLRAAKLNTAWRGTLSDLDLDASGTTDPERARVEAALRSASGLLASGRIVRSPDGGRLLRATRVFLRAKQPRA